MKPYKLLLLFLLNSLIAGCGQYGGLYFPPKETPPTALPANAPPPKAAPAPADQEPKQELKPEQELEKSNDYGFF